MYELVANLPVKKDFTQPSTEECWKDVMQATCAVVHAPANPILYPAQATATAKLTRIFGYCQGRHVGAQDLYVIGSGFIRDMPIW
jgi:hypothetical protein